MPDPVINGRRIDQLTPGSVSEASNDAQLWPYAPPVAGEAKKITTAGLKTIFQPYVVKYIATGSEGSTLIVSAIANKYVLLVVREGVVTAPTESSPDSLEFTWDGTSLVLGAPANPGERFLILYKTI
jgi:hypothetical protein